MEVEEEEVLDLDLIKVAEEVLKAIDLDRKVQKGRVIRLPMKKKEINATLVRYTKIYVLKKFNLLIAIIFFQQTKGRVI